MSDRPTVTLAIPCCNASNFIGDALASVARLDPEPLEVLVVDDGSTDGSALAARRGGARVIAHGENRGIGAARNTALAEAAGDVVVYVDADTLVPPDLLARLLEPYSDPGVGGAGGQGVEVHRETIHDRWRSEVLFQGWGDVPLASAPFLFGLCSSWRREALARIGGFDPVYRVSGEDMDASFRMRSAGYRLAYVPEARVSHVRSDTRESLEKMTYRHCFWGFVAQRRNSMFDNKVSAADSARLFFRQLLVQGIGRGDLQYARLTARLHGIVARAWLDAARFARGKGAAGPDPEGSGGWEGHRGRG